MPLLISEEEANNNNNDSCMSHPSLKKPKIEPFYPHSLITASEFLRSLKPIILPNDPETWLEKQCQIMAKCFPRPNDTHRRITESIGNKKKDRYKTKSGHENLSILSPEEFFHICSHQAYLPAGLLYRTFLEKRRRVNQTHLPMNHVAFPLQRPMLCFMLWCANFITSLRMNRWKMSSP